jgi:hypothetical protein
MYTPETADQILKSINMQDGNDSLTTGETWRNIAENTGTDEQQGLSKRMRPCCFV